MKPIISWIIPLIFLGVLTAGNADPFRAIYLEGQVEKRLTSGWMELDIGEIVDFETVIRLSGRSYAQFEDETSKFTISSSGTFNVGELYKKLCSFKVNPVRGKIEKYINGLTKSRQSVSGVAGVRGTEILPDDMIWATENTSVNISIEDGFTLASVGDMENALGIFRALGTAADVSVENERRLGIAYCMYEMGDTVSAIKELRIIDPSGLKYRRALFVILAAYLYIDTGAQNEAVDLLEREISSYFYNDTEMMELRSLLMDIINL